jgi:hypothetical protein
LDPIPASVNQIKADQPKRGFGYGYVFRFAVSGADLELIVKSRPFRQTENMRVIAGGGLYWDWKDWDREESSDRVKSVSFMVYRDGQTKPSWFDLESWKQFESYALRQEGKYGQTDIQVLIYNPQLGQAYFIVFHYEGGVPLF